ncbi:MAG: hypothetical protein HQM09_01485 [Candidatus Riflebacteria bacterium]|nr:hypothetical protein [Candidatus Riflebacteria bacterium]
MRFFPMHAATGVLFVLLLGLVCVFSPVYGQVNEIETPEGGDPSGQRTAFSNLAGSAGVMTDVMNLAGANDLEVFRCTLISGANTDTEKNSDLSFKVVLFGNGFDAFRKFYSSIQKNWTPVIKQLNARSRGPGSEKFIEFSFDLMIKAAGGVAHPASIDEIVRPLGNLPFFGGESVIASGIQLFAISWENGKQTSFQVVAHSLDEFATLASLGDLPNRSRTISRSSFSGSALYNLDLCVDSTCPKTDELITQFRELGKIADTRELSIEKAPGDAVIIKTILTAAPADIDSLVAFFSKNSERWEITLIDATPTDAGRWSFSLFLRMVPVERTLTAFPVDEIRKVLVASWPESVRENMKFSWTPARMTISAEMRESEAKDILGRQNTHPAEHSQEQKISLSETANSIGMNLLDSKAISGGTADDGNVGEGRVRVVFIKKLAPDNLSGTSGSTLNSDEKNLFSAGNLIERIPLGESTRYHVRIPVNMLPKLISGLSPNDKRTLTSFSLRCEPPADSEAIITISHKSFPGAGRFFQMIQELVGTRFPWNVPDDSLAKSISLHELDVSMEGQIQIRGVTAKSGRIFSELFPSLQRIPGISEPFFREGNYRDSPYGRLMKFSITATGASLHSN